MTEQPPSADDDLREWFWRCSLNLQNAAIKSVPQIAHPCDADHFADDAMRRVDALIAQRVSAEMERSAGESFQCPSCYWHQGHDAAEWFAEEAKIRGYSAPAGGRRDRPAATEQPAQESDVQRLKREGRLAPFPSAVVDYTERARELLSGCVGTTHFRAGDPDAGRRISDEKLVNRVAAALSAVASERDAAPLHLDTLEADEFSEISDVERGERGDEYVAVTRAAISDALSDQRAALLGRLQEPDVREAVKAAMRERDFARDGEYLPDDCYEAFADAALTKIAETLTP